VTNGSFESTPTCRFSLSSCSWATSLASWSAFRAACTVPDGNAGWYEACLLTLCSGKKHLPCTHSQACWHQYCSPQTYYTGLISLNMYNASHVVHWRLFLTLHTHQHMHSLCMRWAHLWLHFLSLLQAIQFCRISPLSTS